MIEKGSITSGLPERILNDELAREIQAKFGDIGWAAEWDKDKNLVAIHFEYEADLGIDPGALKKAFQAHSVPEGVDDDFQATEKRQEAERQKAADLDHVLATFEKLEARVAELEALAGVGVNGSSRG